MLTWKLTSAGRAYLSVHLPRPGTQPGRLPPPSAAGGQGEPVSRLLVAQSPRDPRVLVTKPGASPSPSPLWAPTVLLSSTPRIQRPGPPSGAHAAPPPAFPTEAGCSQCSSSLLVAPPRPVLPLLCKSSSPQLSPYCDCRGHRTRLRSFPPQRRESCGIFLPISTCHRSRAAPRATLVPHPTGCPVCSPAQL